MELMAAKKKATEKRATHLGIRLTDSEERRVDEVAKLFPELPKSTLLRFALMAGLDAIERNGINLTPKRRRKQAATTNPFNQPRPGGYRR